MYDPLEDLVERTDFFGYPVALDSQITDTPFQTFFKTYCVSVTSSPVKVAADLEGTFFHLAQSIGFLSDQIFKFNSLTQPLHARK